MTLLDILKLMEKDYFPVTVDKDGNLDTRPESIYNVTICFMCEEETWLTCNIQNEILIPWYDCEVNSIEPDNDHKDSICVWLKDSEFIRNNYPQHLFYEDENIDYQHSENIFKD